MNNMSRFYFFFFQAEDGIRDKLVTGVQTCALPICRIRRDRPRLLSGGPPADARRPPARGLAAADRLGESELRSAPRGYRRGHPGEPAGGELGSLCRGR